ncbi:MAG: hypothetical protein PT120_01645 [Aphanizomenon gracile PMC649.10]|nr:hypothetical protein [Aphanizomenon gracile PMC649.10]MDM3862716.1 hypothetical protein [Aphanizomenon gracile PMC644.10]
MIFRSCFVIALPTSPNSDRTSSTSPNSDRTFHIPQLVAPHSPKSELLAAAVRYRPSLILKTANCLQQRLAIALPHPKKSDR